MSIANAHAAVIAAADDAATLERLLHHGSPVVRHAAERMAEITAMHAHNDHNPAREHKIADDALYYLPMAEIEKLVAAYEVR